MTAPRLSLTHINALPRDNFVRVISPAFERSPWIAEAAAAERPFATVEELHHALCRIVLKAGEEKQLALIRAHPELGRRAALAGTLSRESAGEQASAGLSNLAAEEIAHFRIINATYRQKFDFPFVICARLNQKEAILQGFATRLQNTREEEIATALAEIGKIAGLRLNDLISPE